MKMRPSCNLSFKDRSVGRYGTGPCPLPTTHRVKSHWVVGRGCGPVQPRSTDIFPGDRLHDDRIILSVSEQI